MNTTRREHTLTQRLFSLLLTLALVLGMVPITGVSAAESAPGITTDGVRTDPVNIATVADPETLTRPETIYGSNTLNAGKVTVGKSVSNSAVTVNGQTIDLKDPDNFLVTVSQSAQVMGLSTETKVPVDVVFVLDTSGSMQDNNRDTNMVTAANTAINTLLEANPNNRIGVVAFSAYKGTNHNAAAEILSQLAHYNDSGFTQAESNHLTWSGNSIVGRGINAGSRSVTGGTDIQAGIALGARMLMEATPTVTVDGETLTRMPFLIILSDGAPTFSLTDEAWYDNSPVLTGEQGPGNNPYAGNGFLAALTAAYYKGKITERYYGANASEENRCYIYSLGVQLDSLGGSQEELAQITMDPSRYLNNSGNDYSDDFASYWNSYTRGAQFTISVNGNNGNHSGNYTDTITTTVINNTKDYVNGKSAAGATMYTGGLAYNDGYYNASQTSQIAGIFEQVVTEISKKAISAPTKVDAFGEDFSGYVTFHDPIGEYMEVKDMKGIIANNHYYRGDLAAQHLANRDAAFMAEITKVLQTRLQMTSSSSVTVNQLLDTANRNSITWWGKGYRITGEEEPGMQVLAAAGNDSVEYIESTVGSRPSDATHVCRSYFFYGTNGNASDAEYLYFIVRVQRSLKAPYQQTVVISAPASLLSMDKVLITEESDGTFTASVEKSAPARVVYEVGLRSDITAENVEMIVSGDTSDTFNYKNEAVEGSGSVNYDAATGTYNFFTNDWDRSESLDSHHRAQARATFDAAADNAFYTYQQNTLIVDGRGNPVTSDPRNSSEPTYYVRTYYEWGTTPNSDGTYTAAQRTALIRVDIPANAELHQDDVGRWYIPKGAYTGATLVVNGDDTLKDDPTTAADDDGNRTKTSAIVAHPHRTGDASNSHYTVYLGNNGMLSLKANTPKPTKTVKFDSHVDGNGQPVKVGDILTYEITVKNPLPDKAIYTITDTVPKGTALEENSISDGGNADATGKITWAVEIPAEETVTVSFQVKVTKDALNTAIVPSTIQNTAVVTFPNGAQFTTNPVENPPFGKTAADENGNDTAASTTGYKVGDIITYSIRYHNTTNDPANITITDQVPDGTVLVENNPISHGGTIATDAQGKTVITWNLTDVQPNVAGVVTFRVKITADAENTVTNSALIEITNGPTIDTNSTETKVNKGDLVLTKTVEDANKRDETFTLTLTADTTLLNGTYTMVSSKNGNLSVVFKNGVAYANENATEPGITIAHDEKLTIQGLPAGVKITVAETAGPGWTPTYNDKTTAQQVTIDAEDDPDTTEVEAVSVKVSNDYHANPVSFQLQGTKIYQGATYPRSLDFSFQAQRCDKDGNLIPGQDPVKATVTINAAGEQTFSFSQREYTEAFDAPRYYLITEEVPASKIPGMIYDTETQYLLYLNVEDNNQGNLKLTATLKVWDSVNREWDEVASAVDQTGSVTLAGANFTNTYPTSDDITLGGSKTLTGRWMTNREFSFQLLVPGGTNGATVIDTATSEYNDSNGHEGIFNFSTITYTAADMLGDNGNVLTKKNFTYYIREVPGNASNTTYDTAIYEVVVTVTSSNGALSANVTKVTRYAYANAQGADVVVVYDSENPSDTFDKAQIAFENEFKVQDTRVTLTTGSKVLTGRTQKAGEFSFSVYRAVDDQGQIVTDSSGNPVLASSGTNLANGNIVFAPIGFTVEQMKDDNNENILASKDFYFVVMEDIPAEDGGTFDPNMYYDPIQYLVKVTVTYNASNGSLSAGTPTVVKVKEPGAAAWDDADSEETVVFKNIQNDASIFVTPVGTKIIEGSNLPNGLSFSFKVVPVTGGTDAATGTSEPVGQETARMTETSKPINFTSMVYTYDVWNNNRKTDGDGNDDVATFKYWIMESNTGAAGNGITYSTARYLYVVELSRSATNALVVTESYYAFTGTDATDPDHYTELIAKSNKPDSYEGYADFAAKVKDEVQFENSYDAKASINLTATKVLKNDDLLLREFDFVLQRLNENGTLVGTEVSGSHAEAAMDSNNKATATVNFATLNYTTGTGSILDQYTSSTNPENTETYWYINYLMSEVKPEGVAVPGVEYDSTKYIVTIKITQNQDGDLTAVLDDVAVANYDERNQKYDKGDTAEGFVKENNSGNTGVTFTNTYSVQTGTTVTIKAHKTLTGRDFIMENGVGEFGFVLYRLGKDGNNDVWHNIGTAFNDANGNISFTRHYNANTLSHLAFVNNQYTVTYRIDEINGGLGGVKYSEKSYLVDVVIEHDESSASYSVASITYTDKNGNVVAYTEDGQNYYASADNRILVDFNRQVYFNNTYTTNDAGFKPVASKELLGKNGQPKSLENYDFSFEVVEVNADGSIMMVGETGKKHAKVVSTGRSNEDGKVIFSDVVFNGQMEVTCENEVTGQNTHYHYFMIREDQGTDATITYSKENYYIKVAVTDNGSGKLSVTEVIYYSDAFQTLLADVNGDTVVDGKDAVFTNHHGPGTVDLNLAVTKRVDVVYPTMQTFALRQPTLDPNAPYVLEGSEFDFEVYEANSSFEIQQKDGKDIVVASGTNGEGSGTATVPFTTITYTRSDMVGAVKNEQTKLWEKNFYYVIKELYPSTGSVPGVDIDRKEIYVTVTVTDDGYGNMTATPVYTDNDDETTGDAEKTFVNTYTVRDSVEVTLTAVKKLTGKAMEEFSFKLVGEGKELTAVNDSDGNITFDALTFNLPGTYTYTVSEVSGTSNAPGTMTYDTTVYTVTIKVYDDREGKLYTEITINNGTANVDLMEFVNRYTHPELTVDLSDRINADKLMRGPNGEDLSYLLKQHTFEFEVKDLQGRPVENANGETVKGTSKTEVVDGKVSITFPKFTFKTAGEYHYLISEVPNGEDNGVTTDPQVWCVHISVIYNRQTGLLEINRDGCTTHPYNATTHNAEGVAVQDYQNPEFINRYDADGVSLTITAGKSLTGRDLKDHEFTFRLLDANGNIAAEARNRADGTITFLLDYELADLVDETGKHVASKRFTYTMVEVIPDTQLGGVSYSQQSYPVTVTVTDTMLGKLKVTIGTDGEDYANKTYNSGIQFTNTYAAAEVQVQIDALKRMDGTKPLAGNDYTFRLEGSGLNLTAQNDADGKIRFTLPEYTAAGVYTYKLTEVHPQTVVGGVTFDETEYLVTVTVTDDLRGQLHAQVVYSDEDGNIYAIPVFTNTYLADGVPVTIEADKVLTGKALTAGEFTFKLFDAEGSEVASVTNDAQGNVVFPQMVFASTGVYTYTISEVAGTNAGVTYDETVYTVTVTVTDENFDGTLDAVVAYTNSGTAVSGVPVFRNTYKADSVDVQISAEKDLSGKDLEAEEFSFTLVNKADAKESYTAKNDADGKIDFPKITFTAADMVDAQGNPVATKSFQYTLSEVRGTNPGIAYDTDQYTVTITVTDDGKGQLSATVDYTLNKITVEAPVFHNSYDAGSVSVIFEAEKVLNGKDLTAGQFGFLLKTEDGTVLDTLTNGDDGKIVFKPITYTDAKVYTYTLAEIKGNAKGMTYDATVYTITVTVTDDGNGQLTATTAYTANGKAVDKIVFTNTYKAQQVAVDVHANKTLIGKDLTADAFSFTLVNKNESYTAKNGKDGTVTFQGLTFTEAGVYTYTLSEVKGSAPNTDYDETVYTVVITVTDDGKGQLTAVTQYKRGDQTVEEASFTNVYTPEPLVVPLKAEKDLAGRKQVAGEFTFQVKDAEGNLITTGTNAADGTIVFDEIVAYGVGEAVLYISEVAGDAERMEYDDYIYRVKVEVTNDNGNLVATVTYMDGDIVFYNVYESDVPATGDSTELGLYAGLLVFSLLAMAIVLVLYWKKEKA